MSAFTILSYAIMAFIVCCVWYISYRGVLALGEWLAERVARKVSK